MCNWDVKDVGIGEEEMKWLERWRKKGRKKREQNTGPRKGRSREECKEEEGEQAAAAREMEKKNKRNREMGETSVE